MIRKTHLVFSADVLGRHIGYSALSTGCVPGITTYRPARGSMVWGWCLAYGLTRPKRTAVPNFIGGAPPNITVTFRGYGKQRLFACLWV